MPMSDSKASISGTATDKPSVNRLADPLVQRLIEEAAQLRIGARRTESGATLVDAGIQHLGGIEAGRRIAEICLGGLGEVSVTAGGVAEAWPVTLHVHTSDPVLACLGSQYAGWSLSHGEGKKAFHALGSGPARALALKEPLYKDLNYRDEADMACLVLEVEKEPPPALVEKIARDCGVAPDRLTLILTPTSSLAGSTQVVARVVEVAMHKAHELKFPLEHIVDAVGSAPLAPPAPDFIRAMGRTNDAILFAGQVQLYIRGDDGAAKSLADRLPSSASKDYGRPFADIFKAYEYDFFKIDPMLFSPAKIVVTAMDSGRSFHAGGIDLQLLQASFAGAPK
jgi:methenyltetrahydromethanopterin cyclohydrolase